MLTLSLLVRYSLSFTVIAHSAYSYPFSNLELEYDDEFAEAASSLKDSDQYEVEEEDGGNYEDNVDTAGSNLYSSYVGGLGNGQLLGNGFGQFGGINRFGFGGVTGPGGGGAAIPLGTALNIGNGGISLGLSNGGLGLGANGFGYNGGLGYFPNGQIVQAPFIGGGYGLHGHSGGYVDKNQYEAAKKKADDENYHKAAAKVEEEAKQENEGFAQGSAAELNAKGETGYYKDEEAKKQAFGDGKSYQGAQNFNKAAKNENSDKAIKSHKKGHVTKGFKSSSQKNEEEKTETFYDEAHDEADARKVDQNHGVYGEQAENSYKGGSENESLDAKKHEKEGHFKAEQKAEDAKANKSEYGQSAYKGNAEQLNKSNNLGAHTILGHQESSGIHQENKPYGILPIYAEK